MNIPTNLKYTKDHEWIKLDGEIGMIGITDFAQKELGDIVFVEVETEGETLNANDIFGTIEAVKTVSDLLLPVGGEIIEFNESLANDPSAINNDPYGNGWIIKIKVANPTDVDQLLDADQYKALIGA